MNKPTATLLQRFYGRFMGDTQNVKYDDAKRAWQRIGQPARAAARRRMRHLMKAVPRRQDIRPEHRPLILKAIEPLVYRAVVPRVAQERHAARYRRLCKSERGRALLRRQAVRRATAQ